MEQNRIAWNSLLEMSDVPCSWSPDEVLRVAREILGRSGASTIAANSSEKANHLLYKFLARLYRQRKLWLSLRRQAIEQNRLREHVERSIVEQKQVALGGGNPGAWSHISLGGASRTESD